jgi:hypothetical protein
VYGREILHHLENEAIRNVIPILRLLKRRRPGEIVAAYALPVLRGDLMNGRIAFNQPAFKLLFRNLRGNFFVLIYRLFNIVDAFQKILVSCFLPNLIDLARVKRIP